MINLTVFTPYQTSPFGCTGTNHQFVSKLFITKWIGSLIWINASPQYNYVGPDLFPQIQEHKAQYVSLLLGSTELIVHIEASPSPTKADLMLGLRFLSDLMCTLTDQVLSIKTNGTIIQTIQTHD